MRRSIFRLLPIWLLCSACNEARLPAPYRDLEVPQDRLASLDSRRNGRRVFIENCAICHGVNADGRGVRRHSLSSRPVDFTRPDWRRRSSPRRVYYVVREGVRGTPMPAWKALEPEETWDVVAYVLSVSGTGPEPTRGEGPREERSPR